MKITEIADKGATIAWSPFRGEPDIIALGTKVRTWSDVLLAPRGRPCL